MCLYTRTNGGFILARQLRELHKALCERALYTRNARGTRYIIASFARARVCNYRAAAGRAIVIAIIAKECVLTQFLAI